MIIRKGKEKDINNNLLKLYIEGFRYHYNGRPDIFTNKTDEELKQDLINDINNTNFLVLEDDIIVGYITYKINNKHAKVLWTDQLVVDEGYRKKGYGKQLFNKVKEIAKEENCKRIELSCWSFNQNALDMYEHIGFKNQKEVLEMEL